MTVVLVTGSAGFLGGAVCRVLLSRGIEIVGVDIRPSDTRMSFQTFADDLSDRDRIADYLAYYGVTHIIHCGGISSPWLGTPEEIVTANTGGSMNLAIAACRANVRRFVFASSIAAAAPKNAYGCSKAAAELVLHALNQHGNPEFCTLRFAGIYGPGRRTPILPHDLVAAALNGTAKRVSSRATHAYVYIEDAAKAAVQACFAKAGSERHYDIAHPEGVTALQIAKTIQQSVPSFRFDIVADGVEAAALDVLPARRDLDFHAETRFSTGIARVIEWMSAPAFSAQQPSAHARAS